MIFQVQIYPPPKNLNLGRSWNFVIFQVQITPPHQNMKLWQIFPMGKYVWQVTTYGDFIQPG